VSKYAVAGLAETLVQELRGSSIGVTCVYPGGIRTNIVRKARGMNAEDIEGFDQVARISPDRAARVILAGILKGKRRVLIGASARILDWAKRLFPRGTVNAVGFAAARREASLQATRERPAP
jgi:short-subunit dehydrogenase